MPGVERIHHSGHVREFFIHDVISRRKYWSPRREWTNVPYIGNHKRIVAYGAITKNGRQLFRTRELFDAAPSSDASKNCRGTSERWRR